MEGLVGVVIIVAIVLFVLSSCIKIVPQAQAFVVERLGGYQGNMGCRTSF